MKKIAIFASGSGSNFKTIFTKIFSGDIAAKICLIVSNNPNCGAVKFASEKGIKILILNKIRFPNSIVREETLLSALINRKTDLICLAGYMKLLPKRVVEKYKGRILNIHPALLPLFGGKGFYGMKVHEAVIAAGVKESGVTIHLVDEEYDHGKIIVQKKVEVRPGETVKSLAERVLKIEHDLYPRVIQAFCRNNDIWENNQPIIEVNIEN